MDGESGGPNDSGVESRGLTKQFSATNLNISGMSERAFDVMNISRVNALRATVCRHSDALAGLLLSCKELKEKKVIVESAFRACRDAFMEVATVLVNVLEERSSSKDISAEDVRKVVEATLDTIGGQRRDLKIDEKFKGKENKGTRTYASAASAIAAPEVHVSGGPTVELENTTSFLIMPDVEKQDRFNSSQETKDALSRVFKPSDCGLKVKKISLVRNNGVKIEALSPDIERIKTHPGLLQAGLKVVENAKMNPRLIVRGIPADMEAKDIKKELIAQNLDLNKNCNVNDIKVVYIFPPNKDKRTTSCIIEVSPDIRRVFFLNGRIYLRYAACSFADHVRVLQCFRCCSFGHIAKDCKSKPACGHCSGEHELRDCKFKNLPPKCLNCQRYRVSGNDHTHVATDARVCPVLCRKIKDRISSTNYE